MLFNTSKKCENTGKMFWEPNKIFNNIGVKININKLKGRLTDNNSF